MRRNFTNRNGKAGGIMSHFAAQKKKSIVAVALILVMVFMWVKALRNESPQPAGAATLPSEMNLQTQQNSSDLKVSFIRLPFIPGRHDVLSHDFFQMDSSMFGSREQINILSSGGGDNAKRIAEMLKLDAIVMGNEREAFINDKLLKIGDKIIVPDGANNYECEVSVIEENLVIVKVEETEVELRLKDKQEALEQ